MGEDEPWIAAAPYKLATQGVYGSDLFAGYYGVDRHNYQHMPLYPLLQAAIFKVIGVGVLEMRVLPVAFGLALLLVVFLVGRQVGDARVGGLAVVLLLMLRIADGGEATGILLLDRARINRYDIAVPVFGLLAWLTFNRAERRGAAPAYVGTGVLAALSSLSHLFGAFWLPVFVGLTWLRQPGRMPAARAVALILAGFTATWLPCVAYIAMGWSDFLGQMSSLSPRVDLFNPSFYISNVLSDEGPISLGWIVRAVRELPLDRPGAWALVVGVPIALGVMLWQARRHRHQAAWTTLTFAAIAQLAMFVLLLKVKTINYMIGLWPLGAILLAWLGIWLWDRRGRYARVALLTLLGLIVFEGSARVAHARSMARRVSPYDWFESQVASCIPAGSLVLGLQHYWLGLRQYPYRTWLVPVSYANPLSAHERMTLDDALQRIDPDIILIDRHMAQFFESAAASDHPYHALHTAFTAFMSHRRAEPICVIRDSTYGAMTVFSVPAAQP